MQLQDKALLCLTVVCYGSHSCPENCQKADKPTLRTCNPDTLVCSRGCVPGYYGVTCNLVCDENCKGRTCQQHYGTCVCSPGYTFNIDSCETNKGSQCKWNENCLNNVCRSENRDECLNGCKPGWFGDSCHQKCPGHCVCSHDSGTCSSCEEGWYGEKCESRCSTGCAGSKTACERDGTCRYGCHIGYYGNRCELSCPNECKSRSCSLNGTCDSCKKGFFGQLCHLKCEGCFKGICDETTGVCAMGCVRGFYGAACTLRCKGCDGSCDADTGDCIPGVQHEDESRGVQIWVGGGVVAIIIIIVAVIVYIYCRLKRIQGMVYNVMKRQRPSPNSDLPFGQAEVSVNTDVIEEARIIPPTICPITSNSHRYIVPCHNSGTGSNNTNQLHMLSKREDPDLTAASQGNLLSTDMRLRDLIRSSDEMSDDYTLPNYCEVDEDLVATLPQPVQGADGPAQHSHISSFSVVADVHVHSGNTDNGNAKGGDITIPLIADCFWNNDQDDSSHEEVPRPDDENYDRPFKCYVQL